MPEIIDVLERWEEGMDHHPLSEKIYKAIADIDFNHNDDYFCWKEGGDGDNGEILMYVLDIYFENTEEGKALAKEKPSTSLIASTESLIKHNIKNYLNRMKNSAMNLSYKKGLAVHKMQEIYRQLNRLG